MALPRPHRVLGALAMTAAVAATVIVANPQRALAAITLTNGSPVTSNVAATYKVTTSQPYWSVVGLKPPSTADYDLTVKPGLSSSLGGSAVDFVAINTNLCPGGTRTAAVELYEGKGTYTVEFADRNDVLNVDPLPFPSHNPNIISIFGPGSGYPAKHFIGVVDVWLEAGVPAQVYAAQVGGNAGDVYVMAPDPAFTCARSPGGAVIRGRINQGSRQSVTLDFTPSITGWYGIVEISWGPNPQSGYSSIRVGQNA